MHAIGDVINRLSGKHRLRDFTVNLGNTVRVAAEMYGKESHGEAVLPCQLLDMPWQHISHYIVRETVVEHIVTCLYRSVRSECAVRPHRAVFVPTLTEQFQCE